MTAVTAKMRFTIGALSRKRIINELRSFCQMYDVECDITEYKSLIESTYVVKLKGEQRHIDSVKRWYEEMSKED